jgi:hypothetical protein
MLDRASLAWLGNRPANGRLHNRCDASRRATFGENKPPEKK